jgi:hypothetical protein
MPGLEALAQLRAFDVENAAFSMWTLKKSNSRQNRFRARAVVVSDDLRAELKQIATDAIQRREEVEDYGLLAQTNDTSCLHLGADETLFPMIEALVNQPPDEHLIENAEDLLGSAAYLVRMEHQGNTLHCVCRLAGDWTTKERRTRKNVIFRRSELDLAQDDVFTISKHFDFFVLNQDVLVVTQKNFESLLEYKTTYINSFAELKADRGFQSAFADMAALETFVGINTTHLRRMAVVQERGFYNNPAYMQRLVAVNEARGWNITFDDDGKIIASAETARSIIHVLLNHRLRSELSETDFDVPSASPVGG